MTNQDQIWKKLQEADAKWLRQSKLWDLLSIALLVSFGWLFLNPHLILQFVR